MSEEMPQLVESIYALKDWMSKTANLRLTDNFVDNLCNGVVLCLVINGLVPDKIEINLDGDNDAALQNLENFLQAAKEMGVDDQHLFAVKDIHLKTNPAEDVLKKVYHTLNALKLLSEEKGSLEEQNKWTKPAAETRAQQEKIETTYAKKENKQLDDVTAAVREFKNRTNDVDDLRYKKEGQQKWKLFETNYQRNKGITVEESMREIEHFSKTGEAPAPAPTKTTSTTVGGMAFRDKLEGKITKKQEEKTGRKVNLAANGSSIQDGVFVCKSGSGFMRPEQGEGEFLEKPKFGGHAGDDFFRKFSKQEQKKFKPGNENNAKKLW